MSSNSFLKRAERGRFLKRSLALLLAFVLLLALLPRLELTADAAYYDDAIQKLIGWNVLRGYPDGSLNPDSNITRAEFVALINRAYGYDELTTIPFTDVPGDAWFHNDISAAYAAGYFTGSTPVTANPYGDLTREQAMVLLARNMRLEEDTGEVTSFSDGRAFQSYSAGYANTAVSKGLISGYGDGSFRPNNNITRGEMAVMLSRALGSLVNGEGTYSLGDVFGNVTINSPNVTLRDTVIAGDLYLTGGLGLGGVTLENVQVLGDIIVAGGGESNAGESVILRNVKADSIVVDTLLGEYVSLRAEGDTNIGKALLISDAYLQDRTPPGMGFQTILMEGVGKAYTLSGNLENVVHAAPYSMLRVSQGIVKNLTMDEAGVGSALWLDGNATVLNLTLDTATSVTGRGDVRKLNVNVAGTSTEMLPDEIEIRPGLTGVIAGETMDTAAAAEASSDPHIQAEYPKVINVAATTATATFSTNKSGRLYWAITAIPDGSVNEEGLLTPAAQSRIVKSGNLTAERSNTVYSVPITGLTSGGNYYLSAMLVDARGDYSPVKVVSFATTDNSTPAFGSGFPYMSEINDTNAWASVMATKDCHLYWVVFDKGSSAPTAASFRSGAFTGAYGYGVKDMQRNISESFEVNIEPLEELKSYDIYFWLNDPDSAKSSAVKKLSFTTVDRTPPVFNLEPTVTTIAATSLKLTTNVNEGGTVYWVIVEGEEDYPKQPNTSIQEMEQGPEKMERYMEYFRLQIANGMNGLKAGSVKVRANIDATINITGLQAETQYRIYFIAKDNAGNYSEIEVKPATVEGVENGYELKGNYIWASTKDERPPTVKQEFTRYRANAEKEPYADTDIRIVFSERVQYYEYPKQTPLDEAYKAYQAAREARTKGEISEVDFEDAEDEYLGIMRKVIRLYASNGKQVNERSRENEHTDGDWVIDYRNAEVSKDGKTVTFPTVTDPVTEKPTAASALNLNSDATYYFKINYIADTSDAANQMGEYQIENFKTIAAQVDLMGVNIAPPKIKWQQSENVVKSDEEVHVVYSMTPISVSRADPAKSWDMFIWADHNVKFKMYSLKKTENAGAPTADDVWTPVRTIAAGDTGDPAEGAIVKDDSYTEKYRGLSYWLGLRNADPNSNPYIRDSENGLEDGYVYYYAIQLTEIEGEVPVNWSGNVNFWITVDTGDANSFGGWAQDLSESNYGRAISPEETVNRLVEISNSADGSERFIRTASFTDKLAPKFADGFPDMDAELYITDTTMRARIRLEREGTVFWVVAKAGEIDTTRLYYSEPQWSSGTKPEGAPDHYDPATDSKIGFGDYDVPTGGNTYGDEVNMVHYYTDSGKETKINADKDGNWYNYPMELATPLASRIYIPNFSNSEIQSGNLKASGFDTIDLVVTGLEAGRQYFIYFVIKGTSQVYSEHTYLYKFETKPAYRPKLDVSRPQTHQPTIKSTSMDASVEYALFRLDRLTTSDTLLNWDFSRVLDPDYEYAEGETPFEEVKDSNGRLISTYKVYEAMQSGPGKTDEDTYFDKYADPSYKLLVYDLVTSSSASDLRMGGTGGSPVEIKNGASRDVDCTEYGIDAQDYYFLAVGRYVNAEPDELTGNSYSFRAVYPIYKEDTVKPKLVDIRGNITVTYTGTTPSFDGKITMTFDKDLAYIENSSTRYTVHQADTAGSYKSVKELGSGTGIGIEFDGSDAQTPTKVIVMKMTDTWGQIDFVANRIASARSPDTIGRMSLKVNLNAYPDSASFNFQPATCTFTTPEAEDVLWDHGEDIDITVTLKTNSPQVRSVSLPTGLSVDLGKSAWPTANVTFVGTAPASSTVTWSVDDPTIVGIDPSETTNGAPHSHQVKLTGLKAGQTMIHATCSGVTADCVVIVNPVNNVRMNQSDVTVARGEFVDVSYTLSFPETEVKEVVWTSDTPSVAGVSAAQMGRGGGVIHGVSEGTAKITAAVTTMSGETLKATTTVTVTN